MSLLLGGAIAAGPLVMRTSYLSITPLGVCGGLQEYSIINCCWFLVSTRLSMETKLGETRDGDSVPESTWHITVLGTLLQLKALF